MLFICEKSARKSPADFFPLVLCRYVQEADNVRFLYVFGNIKAFYIGPSRAFGSQVQNSGNIATTSSTNISTTIITNIHGTSFVTDDLTTVTVTNS